MTNETKDNLFKMWETELYDKLDLEEEFGDYVFEHLAVGFFIAKGCSPEEARNMYQHCINKGKF